MTPIQGPLAPTQARPKVAAQHGALIRIKRQIIAFLARIGVGLMAHIGKRH